jgi:hypothetical protein
MLTEIKYIIITPYTSGRRSMKLRYQSPSIVHKGEWRGERDSFFSLSVFDLLVCDLSIIGEELTYTQLHNFHVFHVIQIQGDEALWGWVMEWLSGAQHFPGPIGEQTSQERWMSKICWCWGNDIIHPTFSNIEAKRKTWVTEVRDVYFAHFLDTTVCQLQWKMKLMLEKSNLLLFSWFAESLHPFAKLGQCVHKNNTTRKRKVNELCSHGIIYPLLTTLVSMIPGRLLSTFPISMTYRLKTKKHLKNHFSYPWCEEIETRTKMSKPEHLLKSWQSWG